MIHKTCNHECLLALVTQSLYRRLISIHIEIYELVEYVNLQLHKGYYQGEQDNILVITRPSMFTICFTACMTTQLRQ